MKEFKSKLTGRISIYSDEEYQEMVDKGVIDLKKFIVTDLRPIRGGMPKEIPIEIKKVIKKKNEG